MKYYGRRHWLRDAIKNAGFTQFEFSLLIGITTPYLTAIMNGQKNPGPETERKICDALDLDPELFRTKAETA